MDRVEIAGLLARLAHLLDEARYEDAATVFADDAVIRSPRGGEVRGIADLISFLQRAHVEDERTQHITTDVVVDVEGDQASMSANQLVFFYRAGQPPHRRSGLRLAYTAVRTSMGWRISEGEVVPAWIDGPPVTVVA
ncbi:nuclear transport factor 2 family protein [Kibdelosporangium philippinense]|uniref:Nuclear transport factor 2 family protein n=1 Tax=Kibdelosporangium philippinense TaxID=211113 RepID=A0ABS8ZIM5_9PSEU|nr:nuclear transport factor 2 family protein [Kibdelosporangium philippinense]MCE7006303.1 nuclear transport factor 2 family protein [Kibdelosporangium philippinense]